MPKKEVGRKIKEVKDDDDWRHIGSPASGWTCKIPSNLTKAIKYNAFFRQISWLIGRNKKDPMKEAAENNLKLAKMSGVVSSKLNLYRNKALIYHSCIIQYMYEYTLWDLQRFLMYFSITIIYNYFQA